MHDPHQQPQNVDDIFAQHLKNAVHKAPEGIWQGIADAMETDSLRKKVLWARLTAAASLALLIGFGAWYFFLGRNADSLQGSGSLTAFSEQRTQHPQPHGKTGQDAASQACDPTTQPQPNQEVPQINFASKRPSGLFLAARNSRILMKKMRLLRINGLELGADLQPAFQDRPLFDLPSTAFEPEIVRSIMDQRYQPVPLKVNEQFALENRLQDQPEREELALNPNNAVAKRTPAFTLGGTASPDFSFASQTPVSLAKVASSSKNALPENALTASRRSTPSTGITTGMKFGYALSERFGVQTGILYTRRSTERDHAITQTGEAEAVETHFDLNLFEVPATIKYNVIDHPKFDYYVNTGLSATLLLNYRQSLVTSSGVSKQKISSESDAFTPAQASLLASTGVQVKLGQRVSMNVEPGLRYGFYTTEYAFTQRHPLSFNAFSGVSYHF
jgi:hypothetical protein